LVALGLGSPRPAESFGSVKREKKRKKKKKKKEKKKKGQNQERLSRNFFSKGDNL
jgi:hypothetical protein